MKLYLIIRCSSRMYCKIYLPRSKYGITALKDGGIRDEDSDLQLLLKSYRSIRLKNRCMFIMKDCYEN